MRPLYIFDLDGTLALTDHRQHLVRGVDTNWREFFAACVDDQPNWPVIATLRRLQISGAECWVWSGRSDEVRAQTHDWLNKFGVSCVPKMRLEGDHTPDEKLKHGWLLSLSIDDSNRLVTVFDDRDKVVAMWREAGVACFQVARGEF